MMIYDKILDEALPLLKGAEIIDYAFGINYILVKTTIGMGAAYTITQDADSEIMLRDYKKGNPAELAEELYRSSNSFESGIGLALINSALNNKPSSREDVFKTECLKGKKVAMVGYFTPMLHMFRESDLKIFELKDMEGTHKPSEAAEIMPECDMVIITGVTFVNKTFHTYLPHIKKDAVKIALGLSCPMSKHVQAEGFIIGGARVLNYEATIGCMLHGMNPTRKSGAVDRVWL